MSSTSSVSRTLGSDPIQHDFFSELPDEISLKIVKLLPTSNDLCSLNQVSRKWHRISSDGVLWRTRLLTHFDLSEDDFKNIPPEKYKLTYNKLCLDTFNIIKLFPYTSLRKDLLANFVKDDFSTDSLIRNLGLYLDSLKNDQIRDILLNEIITNASIKFVRIFLRCNKVIQYFLQEPSYFSIFFRRAAGANRDDIMNELILNPLFADIPAGQYGLGAAFIEAAQNDNIEAMQFLMNNPRFTDIPAGQFGLGEAFFEAAENGHLNAMRLIMKHPRFADISANDLFSLAWAFSLAASKGRLDAMRLMMGNLRFSEISVQRLEEAFTDAVRRGQIGAMRLIIDISKFDQIALKEALRLALPGPGNYYYSTKVLTLVCQTMSERLFKSFDDTFENPYKFIGVALSAIDKIADISKKAFKCFRR